MKKTIVLMSMIPSLLFGAEMRLLTKMPTANKISPIEFKKSKKPAYDCASVKIGPKGNWNAVPGAKSQLFTDVPQTEDAAEDQTKAVRCKLKIYDREKHKTSNADLGESNDS